MENFKKAWQRSMEPIVKGRQNINQSTSGLLIKGLRYLSLGLAIIGAALLAFPLYYLSGEYPTIRKQPER